QPAKKVERSSRNFPFIEGRANFRPMNRCERWCYHDHVRGGVPMALHDPSPKLTYEDYILFPDDGKRHEIIDGEHYVTAAPFVRHQRIVVYLTVSLGGFLRQHPLGELLVAPTDIVLSPHDIVQPDLFFISNERAAIT